MNAMSRIPTPPTTAAAPAASHALLNAVARQLGSVPNMFRLIANSPAALEGYLGLSGALAKGALPAATRERIALAIAQFNGCGYCLAAHTYLGKQVARLDDAEMAANRAGRSHEARADAAVRFAVRIAESHGRIDATDLEAVRLAGYDDAQIVEIVQHVALNIWTNYLNLVGGTEIDFPEVGIDGEAEVDAEVEVATLSAA